MVARSLRRAGSTRRSALRSLRCVRIRRAVVRLGARSRPLRLSEQRLGACRGESGDCRARGDGRPASGDGLGPNGVRPILPFPPDGWMAGLCVHDVRWNGPPALASWADCGIGLRRSGTRRSAIAAPLDSPRAEMTQGRGSPVGHIERSVETRGRSSTTCRVWPPCPRSILSGAPIPRPGGVRWSIRFLPRVACGPGGNHSGEFRGRKRHSHAGFEPVCTGQLLLSPPSLPWNAPKAQQNERVT